MNFKNLILEKIFNGKIWVVTLNREDKANYINRSTANELKKVFIEFDSDPKAFVAILTGRKKFFFRRSFIQFRKTYILLSMILTEKLKIIK